MFCKDCGSEINDNAVICPKCGCAAKKIADKYDQTVYILLGIFLGALGAHNFYIGKTKTAVIQLLISVLSCFTLSIFVSIWAIVEICTNAKNING